MSWQPNLSPVTSGIKRGKVSSDQSPCQMVSRRLSAISMLMTPPYMCCSGHHVSLRLLSLLRVMNISPSPKKKKKKKVLQPSDAQVALDSSTALFCAATYSQLNISKSRGFLVQAQPLASAVVAALPSISFFTGQQTIKHLGVLLGYAMQAASHQQFTGIDHAIGTKDRPCHHGWSSWRHDILLAPCGDCLPWTDRLGTRFLGRCSGSSQVRSVPSSADGGWTIPL